MKATQSMKLQILTVLILFACSSCSVYQYNELSSNITRTPEHPFTIDNDSLRVDYSFNDGSVNIAITNKTDKPLFINWNNSSVIMNGNTIPFWKNEGTLKASSFNGTNTSWIDGTVTNESETTLIPPTSTLRKSPIDLRKDMMFAITSRQQTMPEQFDENSSPIKFRTYLFASFNPNFASPIILDNSFWVSKHYQSPHEIVITPAPDKVAWRTNRGKGDNRKTAAGIVILSGTVLFAVLGFVAVAHFGTF